MAIYLFNRDGLECWRAATRLAVEVASASARGAKPLVVDHGDDSLFARIPARVFTLGPTVN